MYAAICRTMANWWISLPMSAPAVANKNAFWCRIRNSCIGSTLHPKIALIVVKHDYLFIETGGPGLDAPAIAWTARPSRRSEEHTSELQSLLRISDAVF